MGWLGHLWDAEGTQARGYGAAPIPSAAKPLGLPGYSVAVKPSV